MKPRYFAAHTSRGAVLSLLLVTSGCVTMQTTEDVVQQQEGTRLVQQNLDRLKAQVESVLAQQEQLQQQIQQLRAVPQDRVTSSELNAVQSRIAELDRKIAALDAARAQDRQEIVSTLSRNIATITASQRASAPAPRSSSGSSSTVKPKPATGKFYEHAVESGDTLSAIASAYKVSASAIIQANNLKDPGHLKLGQKLLIPVP